MIKQNNNNHHTTTTTTTNNNNNNKARAPSRRPRFRARRPLEPEAAPQGNQA